MFLSKVFDLYAKICCKIKNYCGHSSPYWQPYFAWLIHVCIHLCARSGKTRNRMHVMFFSFSKYFKNKYIVFQIQLRITKTVCYRLRIAVVDNIYLLLLWVIVSERKGDPNNLLIYVEDLDYYGRLDDLGDDWLSESGSKVMVTIKQNE